MSFAAGIVDAWLSATDDGAIAVDAGGRVVLHNPAASRVTGLVPTAALGRPWREVLRLDDAAADRFWSARTTGQRAEGLAEILCAQGNLRLAELTAVPWRDGGQLGVLFLIRDLATLCRSRVAPGGRDGYGSLIGAHPAMRALYRQIEAVAPSDAPVLVEGEPGVGKELAAQLLHARSRRAERPLIAVNCAVGPERLEVELFGRTWTATGIAIGRVELAHTGTLFLDEVGAAPPAVQARLLHLLRTGTVERPGETAPRGVDVRIVAATTRALEPEVRAGRYHPELLHRLRVVRLVVPPLRERLTDLPLLVDHFLARYGPPGCALHPSALALLESHRWPGNVRELEEVIRRAVRNLPCDAGPITVGAELLASQIRVAVPEPPRPRPADLPEDLRAVLLRALSSHGGNRTAAARSLGIGRATFYRWWHAAGLAGERHQPTAQIGETGAAD